MADRFFGVCWIFCRGEARVCPDVSAASDLGPVATEFDSYRRAVTESAPRVVVYLVSGVAGALRGSAAESGPAGDDSLLVRQQLLRSVDRSERGSFPDRRSTAVQPREERGNLRLLCCFCRAISFLVSRCRFRDLESIWSEPIRGYLAAPVHVEHAGSTDHYASRCDLGEMWPGIFRESERRALCGRRFSFR